MNLQTLRVLAVLFLALAGGVGPVSASSDGPLDFFVNKGRPDVGAERFVAGDLGILLPGFSRVDLYPAWRAIAAPSGRSGMSARQLEQACCATDGGLPDEPLERWLKARAKVLDRPLRGPIEPYKPFGKDGWNNFLNCPPAAFAFAVDTLERFGAANPARAREWVAAQDQVFEFCGFSKDVRHGKELQPPPQWPAVMPANTPAPWGALRQYQIAAAQFYAGDFAAAGKAFQAIGRQADHPMRAWGDYLALRSQLRAASLIPTEVPNEALYREIDSAAGRLLSNTALKSAHGATEALLSRAAAQLTPEQRLEQLSQQLARLDRVPSERDYTDWVRLIDDPANPYAAQGTRSQALREQYEFIDWIATIQNCSEGSNKPILEASLANALKRLKAQPEGPWLLPSLMCIRAPHAELDALLRSAEKLPASRPDHLSVQYYRLRQLRALGRTDEARALATQLLAAHPATATAGNLTFSRSALNLLRQEALALASSFDEALANLPLVTAGWRDADTGQSGKEASLAWKFSDAGVNLLNSRITVAQLLAGASDKRIPPNLQLELAQSAWWRAELLGKSPQARAAAERSAALNPTLRAEAETYLQATTAGSRRHALVMAGLRHPAQVDLIQDRFPKDASTTPDQARSDWWCALGDDRQPPWRYPPDRMTDIPAAADLAQEMAGLKALGTATGFFTRYMLAYAGSNPKDPDLPWLLHVAVQSTRGGCRDKDNAQRSRELHNLLQKRFPDNEWAKDTPYWYQ